MTAFGNPGVYIEKYIEDFRHVEIQIIGDNHGNVIHLGERDCSIQRRLQKLLEETPSPAIDSEMRGKWGMLLLKQQKLLIIQVPEQSNLFMTIIKRKFYFMEMNTRIQVEHPVTEMVTGVDLIKEKINVASGKPLSLTQDEVEFKGWSIECRINAENPEKNFMPSAGKIDMYLPPGGFGIRVDSGAYPGYTIPPYYDSMIAKLFHMVQQGKKRLRE